MVGIEIKEDREQVREIGGIGKKVEVGSVVKPEACRWHIAKKKQRMKIEERHQSVAGLKLCRFEGMQCLQDATMEYAPKASSIFPSATPGDESGCFAKVESGHHSTQRWRNAQVCCTERQGRLCAAIGRFPEIGLPLVTPGYPQIIHLNCFLHYKPSILGDPHLWKPPDCEADFGPGVGAEFRCYQAGWDGESFLPGGRCSTFALRPQTGHPLI